MAGEARDDYGPVRATSTSRSACSSGSRSPCVRHRISACLGGAGLKFLTPPKRPSRDRPREGPPKWQRRCWRHPDRLHECFRLRLDGDESEFVHCAAVSSAAFNKCFKMLSDPQVHHHPLLSTDVFALQINWAERLGMAKKRPQWATRLYCPALYNRSGGCRSSIRAGLPARANAFVTRSAAWLKAAS